MSCLSVFVPDRLRALLRVITLARVQIYLVGNKIDLIHLRKVMFALNR